MKIDIGTKRPIEGDQVFLVGHCRWPGEMPFVLLHDPLGKREVKRNLQKVQPQELVEQLGGRREFIRVTTPSWGTAWFRASSIRKVAEMSSRDLELGSETVGCRVLFTHEPEDREAEFPGPGFFLYGITASQAAALFGR